MPTEIVHTSSSPTPLSTGWETYRRRWTGLAVALPCWALLLIAVALTPRTGGTGTHGQLGLPPCSMPARTGYPCPTCGMTTSVSLAAQGRIAEAFAIQPFGVMLVLAACVVALAGSIQAATGTEMLDRLPLRRHWLWLAVAGLLGGWLCKVAWLAADGKLPLH